MSFDHKALSNQVVTLSNNVGELEEYEIELERELSQKHNRWKVELEQKEVKLIESEKDLSHRKEQVIKDEEETRKLFKKLWEIWLFWIVVAVLSAIISVFFVHGYLASDNRAMNKYNKALSSYNTKISDLDTKIYKKNENLKDKYEDLETQYCGTENEWVNLCIGTNEDIKRLSDSIEDLEQQKKELVKPQEPKDKNE